MFPYLLLFMEEGETFMWIQFKKRRLYNGKWYEPGAVVDVHKRFADAYIRARVAFQIQAPVKTPPITVAEEIPEIKPKLVRKAEPVENVEIPASDVLEDTVLTEDVLPELVDYTSLSYRELQKECKLRNLPISGTKEELLSRIVGE